MDRDSKIYGIKPENTAGFSREQLRDDKEARKEYQQEQKNRQCSLSDKC